MIQELLAPMIEAQAAISYRMTTQIDKKMSDLQDQVNRCEYILFKSENPDTRFEKIYEQLNSLSIVRKQDQQRIGGIETEVKQILENKFFEFDTKIKKFESFDEKHDTLMEQLKEVKINMQNQLEKNMRTTQNLLLRSSETVLKLEDTVVKCD
jgi:hypothetical protein